MIRVLVVDDSPLMRRHIGRILEGAGDFTVEACPDGETALARLPDFAPDVVTLDVQMPGLDGLAILARLMAQRPCPVIMVSAFTDRGARTTLEALALGAVDYIAKPEGTISLHAEEWGPLLVEKVRAAATARVRPPPSAALRPPVPRPAVPPAAGAVRQGRSTGEGIVVMGASTGGPRTLESILPELPEDFPWPVVLAQHMPPKFTRLFSERMDRLCPLNVVEVDCPMAVEAGTIYVARGERDMRLARRGVRVMAMPVPPDPIYPWHPSVDALADSVLELYPPSRIVGVLLTGMGRDGAAALTRLRRRGGLTIAESADSAVVFGMPGELVAMGGASLVLPAPRIAGQILEWAAAGLGEGRAACP